MMKKTLLILLIVLLLLPALLAFAEEEEDNNLSEGRTLGIGMQVGFPWGGLVSGRYWFSPNVGAEGIVFMWGSYGDFGGIFTGRFLYRVSDTPAVDFYLAAGGSVPFSSYGENEVILSTVGGIEFTFPFARNLACNVEFGAAVSMEGHVSMAGGVGIHFYF